MRYTVELSAAARRQLRKLPRAVQGTIQPAIDALADNPRPHGVEKLSGEANSYRVRVGEHRIIYEICDTVLLVVVVRIGHRRDVYR